MKITPQEGLQKLAASNKTFIELFTHGTLSVEIYKPDKTDRQQPHDRDEIYVVYAGQGQFMLEDTLYHFQPGDFFFVPARAEHRFQNFTDDFSTWVFFYGPVGGERAIR